MNSAHIFNVIIDLPETNYFFTERVTFWRLVFNIISILFTSIDTAIEDIFIRIGNYFSKVIENILINITYSLYPKTSSI